MQFYIDPGTGSMLFTILVGVLGAGVYACKNLFVKLRFILSGGKKEKGNTEHLPIVIFSDSKRYWSTFEPICRELDERGQKAVYMTMSPDDPGLKAEFKNIRSEFIGEGNKAFAKLNMLDADIVLSTTPGLDVYQWKRSKNVKYYVHVLHAANDVATYRMFGMDYYDAALLSGEFHRQQLRELEKIRNLPAKDLQLVGLPYMDELRRKLEEAPPMEKEGTTVLLAPSWGPNSIFNRYGGRIFEALLKTGYHIIVRPHPQSYTSEKELLEKLQAEFPDSDQLEWNSDNDNFEVLRRSDILISDFSGVTLDFALVFDRPIIYTETEFDKEIYDASWLEEELWILTTLPKIGQKLTEENLPDVKTLIDQCLSEEKYQAAREAARQETWVNIGKSASLCADYLIRKEEELLAEEAREKAEEEKAAKEKAAGRKQRSRKGKEVKGK